MAEEAGVDESYAMRVYHKAHSKEEELNRNFNTYVHVLRAIYAGRNKARPDPPFCSRILFICVITVNCTISKHLHTCSLHRNTAQ